MTRHKKGKRGVDMSDEQKKAEDTAQSTCDGLLYVFLYESGDYHDSPEITRIFRDAEKAKRSVPNNFVEVKIPGYYYYAKNEKKQKWVSIHKVIFE